MDDPLARAVRRRLQEHPGIPTGGADVPMVISTEPPRAGLLPVQDGDEVPPTSLLEYQVVPNFRVRTIPVLGTTPAIFGMAAAAHVVCEIVRFSMFPEPVFGVREGVWTSQLAALCERMALHGADLQQQLDINEVEVRVVHGGNTSVMYHPSTPQVAFLVRDVWRGVSARTLYERGEASSRRGAARDLVGLVLTRWDAARGARLDNLVLLQEEDADLHDRRGVAGARAAEPAFAAFVEQRMADAAAWFLAAGVPLRTPDE